MKTHVFLLRTATTVKPFETRNISHAVYCCDEALGITGVEWRAVADTCDATTTWHRFHNGEDTGTALTAVNAHGLDKEAALDTLQGCLRSFHVEELQFMLARSMMPPVPMDDASERALIAYLNDA